MSGCIHRGKRNDVATQMGYPSANTYCYRVEPAIPIELEHQNEFCLCDNHVNCPLLTGQSDTVTLESIQRKPSASARTLSLFSANWMYQWIAVFSLLLLVVLVMVFW